MAIAYQNSTKFTGSTTAASPASGTLDVGSASDRFLVVGIAHNTGPSYNSYNPDSITSVTYNGTSLTRIDSQAVTGYQGVGVSLWVLHNPASGSNTLSVTYTHDCYPEIYASTYNGVNQSSSVDASSKSTSTTASLTQSVTTTVDNAWLVGIFRAQNTLTAGANTTSRQTSGTGFIVDSNGAKSPSGSYSLIATQTSSTIGTIVVSLAPVSSSTTNSNFFALM